MMLPSIEALPVPAHAPRDVRAWLVTLDLNAPLDAFASVLTGDELARAGRFLRPQDAARFATVRAALRHVLAAEVDIAPHALVIATDAKGRPHLRMDDAPDFNASHSGGFGLIALSRERRVGVDIERARNDGWNWRELAPAVFADADRRAVDALPPAQQTAAFFDCWTAKEAVLKAHGEGIGGTEIGLAGFSVLPREGDRFCIGKAAGAFDAASLASPEGYAAALAWSRD